MVHSSSLKLVVTILAAVYMLAGIASALQLKAQVTPQTVWLLLAGFWVFLAVSLWRLSVIGRTISVTLLWCVVFLFTFSAFAPSYFSELGSEIGATGLQNSQVSYVVIALSAFVALRVLGKHKMEFR